MDNVQAAFKVLHFMKRKTKGKKGYYALRVDISKAYDRVDWGFLEHRMIKFGFEGKWIDLIMMCVPKVNYTILVNDQMVGPIIPSRGLRQGCPISS